MNVLSRRVLRLPTMMLAAALLSIPSACSPTPPHGPASSPAPRTLSYAIPRIDGITIDGHPDDWQDRGFRVDILGESDPPPHLQGTPNAPPFPSIRLAWDQRGLLVLANVHVPDPVEGDTDQSIAQHDSVEVFLGDANDPSRRYRVLISPGIDPDHPRMRLQTFDLRPEPRNPATLLDPTAAAASTPDGYAMEILLPWANLPIATGKPEIGQSLTAQVQVNGYLPGTGDRLRFRWFMTGTTHRDGTYMYPIHLAPAGAASEPVTISIDGIYDRLLKPRLRLIDSNIPRGNQPVVYGIIDPQTGKSLASYTARNGPSPIRATLSLPQPPEGNPYGPLLVTRNGHAITSLRLDDPPSRQDIVSNAEFRMDAGYVFAGSKLPSGDFAEPDTVESALGGPYTLNIKYYDSRGNETRQAEKPGRYGAIISVTAQPDGQEVAHRTFTLFRLPDEALSSTWQWWSKMLMGAPPAMLPIPPDALGINPATAAKQSAAIGEQLFWDWQFGFQHNEHLAIFLAGLSELPPDAPPVVARTSPNAMNIRWWYLLNKRLGLEKPYQYICTVPDDYDSSPAKKYPVILFLHGSGECGKPLSSVRHAGIFAAIDSGKIGGKYAQHFPFIIIAPHCAPDQWWKPDKLNDFLDLILSKYRIDPDRIYLTGLSLGGYGTWALAAACPDRFAAIAPICGAGDPRDMAQLKNLPVWAFHGDADPVVPFAFDKQGVDALSAIGGRIRFTVYKGVGHESWTPAYQTQELYTWFLAQRRNAPQEPPLEPPHAE